MRTTSYINPKNALFCHIIIWRHQILCKETMQVAHIINADEMNTFLSWHNKFIYCNLRKWCKSSRGVTPTFVSSHDDRVCSGFFLNKHQFFYLYHRSTFWTSCLLITETFYKNLDGFIAFLSLKIQQFSLSALLWSI